MSSIIINIANDFSIAPSGRFKADGNFSGEAFREELLLPNLKKYNKVTIMLEGCFGYASSFLEEAFGGLVRLGYFTRDQLLDKLDFSGNPDRKMYYVDTIKKFIKEAKTPPEKK